MLPEQFSEEWDYSTWQQSHRAGNSGSWSNVWGIGCIMYSLVTLQEDDGPIPQMCFYKTGNGDGRIYGNTLLNYINDPDIPPDTTEWDDNAIVPKRNSQSLIECIWSCLYYESRNRIGLLHLHRLIDVGIANTIAAYNTVRMPLLNDK
jgi:hypothetical protein